MAAINKKLIENNDTENERKEFVFKETSIKITFYLIDKRKNINQLSKEIYLKTDKIVHFPIGFNGGSKYKNIQSIEFFGFNKLKKTPPVGFYKSVNFGYGFTKTLKHFASYLDEQLKIKKIIIEKDCKPKYDKKKKTISFNQNNLLKIKNIFETLDELQKKESLKQVTIELHDIFPKEIKSIAATYTPDNIYKNIARWNNSLDEFSGKDKSAIDELFWKLSLTGNFFTDISLKKHKQIIDTKYIDNCYKEYFALMKSKKDTPALEKKWQCFIKENSWIFSYIFSQPIILYKDEAYVGGKNLENKGGKISDFLWKNNLTNNISFLEIKTHKTQLLKNNSYRGNDVFCISDELSGAISQVLIQRDTLQKGYYEKRNNENNKFKSFNSSCIILIGSIKELTEKQQECFELIRSNSKDVEIITYDELLDKIQLFKDLMQRRS